MPLEQSASFENVCEVVQARLTDFGGRLGASNFLGRGRGLQKGSPSAGPLEKSFLCLWCACRMSHKGLRCWELDFVLIAVTPIFVHHRCFTGFWSEHG